MQYHCGGPSHFDFLASHKAASGFPWTCGEVRKPCQRAGEPPHENFLSLQPIADWLVEVARGAAMWTAGQQGRWECVRPCGRFNPDTFKRQNCVRNSLGSVFSRLQSHKGYGARGKKTGHHEHWFDKRWSALVGQGGYVHFSELYLKNGMGKHVNEVGFTSR